MTRARDQGPPSLFGGPPAPPPAPAPVLEAPAPPPAPARPSAPAPALAVGQVLDDPHHPANGPGMATPSSLPELLAMVEAWYVTGWIWTRPPERRGELLGQSLTSAREAYARGRWDDAMFRRNPDLLAAAKLAARGRQALELVHRGDPAGWAALHAVALEARPGLPPLDALPDL